jgi:hypothetical protein
MAAAIFETSTTNARARAERGRPGRADLFLPIGRWYQPRKPNRHEPREPNPMGTFRFAEPVIIEPQQNFRVDCCSQKGFVVPMFKRLTGIAG